MRNLLDASFGRTKARRGRESIRKGGVDVGNFWNRLLYAAKFADVNILLSDRVHPQSKIIYDRTPRQLVQGAAPWLKVVSDAYSAVVEDRIVWIVDGYTTSNSYPNSERVNLNEVTIKPADEVIDKIKRKTR